MKNKPENKKHTDLASDINIHCLYSFMSAMVGLRYNSSIRRIICFSILLSAIGGGLRMLNQQLQESESDEEIQRGEIPNTTMNI